MRYIWEGDVTPRSLMGYLVGYERSPIDISATIISKAECKKGTPKEEEED